MNEISEKEISAFRRENLGFVFQDFNLLDTFLSRKIFSAAGAVRQKISGDEYALSSKWPAGWGLQIFCRNILMKFPADRNSGPRWQSGHHTAETDSGGRADGSAGLPFRR